MYRDGSEVECFALFTQKLLFQHVPIPITFIPTISLTAVQKKVHAQYVSMLEVIKKFLLSSKLISILPTITETGMTESSSYLNSCFASY